MTGVSFLEEIERCIASGSVVLPVFHPAAMRVQQELVRSEPDMQVVQKLITGDQSLASQLLATANSAFYRGLSEVVTVKAAIVRLGIREVGRIVLLVAAKSMFVSGNQEVRQMLKKLWQHSAACAIAAQWIAKRTNLEELASSAFFAGLLHDVGKLLVIVVVEHLRRQKKLELTPQMLLEALTHLHTTQGAALMQKWNMPQIYCEVALDHHRSDFDPKNQLLVIVRLANMVCDKLGISLEKGPEYNLAASQEAVLLQFSELSLAELEIMLEDTKSLVS